MVPINTKRYKLHCYFSVTGDQETTQVILQQLEDLQADLSSLEEGE